MLQRRLVALVINTIMSGLAATSLNGCTGATNPDAAQPLSDTFVATDRDDSAAVTDMPTSDMEPPHTDSGRADSAVRDVVTQDAVDAGPPLPTPIRHVIVLVKENHTLDSMFMNFPGANTATRARRSNGTTLNRPPAPNGAFTADIPHNHAAALNAYNNGAMDGFDRNIADGGTPTLPFSYYSEAQLPGYWDYARHYVLCDNFFSQILGPSFPGHFALWTAQTLPVNNITCAGTSCAVGPGCFAAFPGPDPNNRATIDTFNRNCGTVADQEPCFDVPSVIDRLPAPFTWHAYAMLKEGSMLAVPPIGFIRSATRNRANYVAHVSPQGELLTDLRNGRQANVIYAHILGAAGEHPPADMCDGENYTVQVVNAVMNGPYWRDTAILVTYDDWGGFYDHVTPPQDACRVAGEHVNLGFRVPLLIISPFTRRSANPAAPFVFHGMSEQASIPKLIEELFAMQPMSARDPDARDGRAGSLLPAFDFDHPDFTPHLRQTRPCP